MGRWVRLRHRTLSAVKSSVQDVAHRMGYSIQRITRDKDEYMPCPPYNYHTYAPWFTPWFRDKFNRVKDLTMLSEDRAYTLFMLADYARHLGGDFAECGVFRGGSALLLSDVIAMNGSSAFLYLFDSFKGMPPDANPFSDYHGEGDLGNTSSELVQDLFEGKEFVKIFPGFIPHSLQPMESKEFAFVHVDVDIYSSTKFCLEFFYDRMVQGGVMICDDYGFARYRDAAKKAFDEFFQNKKEKPIVLKTGQCFTIKVGS